MRKIMKVANTLVNKEIKSSHKLAKIFILLIIDSLIIGLLISNKFFGIGIGDFSFAKNCENFSDNKSC